MGLTIGKGTKYDPKTKTGWKREGGKWVYYNKGKKQQHSNILGKVTKNVKKGLSDVLKIGQSTDTYSKEKGRNLTVFEKRRQDADKEPKGYNKRVLDKKKERDSRPVGRNWQDPYGAKGDGKPSSGDVDSASKSSGKKMHSIEKKNREIHGDEAINKLKAKHAKWKADRKKAREERIKKRLKSKK